MSVAGAILVSLLVSVVIVRRRSRASASPEIRAQNASANCPERASAELVRGHHAGGLRTRGWAHSPPTLTSSHLRARAGDRVRRDAGSGKGSSTLADDR